MAIRTIPFTIDKSDGTGLVTAGAPTATVQYGSGAAQATTVTKRGDGWSVDVDDAQDALVIVTAAGAAPFGISIMAVPSRITERTDRIPDTPLTADAVWNHGLVVGGGGQTAPAGPMLVTTHLNGQTLAIHRLTPARAENLDRLDATVSSRLPAIAYTPPDNAAAAAAASAAIAVEGRFTPARAAKLDNIDAAVSSRAAAADLVPLARTSELAPLAKSAELAQLANLDMPISEIGVGVGGKVFEYTVTSTGNFPVAGARVIISTDEGGLNRIRAGFTDDFGKVRFNLDPGTYYVWVSKAGFRFDNPDTEVVS